MTALATLLAAVYAKPADDAVRAVYADALLEQGDVRGEFIALQLQHEDSSRARALLNQHGRRWLGDLEPIVLTFRFERGFPTSVAIDVVLERQIRSLAKSASWATIRTIELGQSRSSRTRSSEKLRMAAIRALAGSPGFTQREFRPALADIMEDERRRLLPRTPRR